MKLAGVHHRTSWCGTAPLLVISLVAITLNCRSQSQDPSGESPRTIEARLGSQVSFSPCRLLEPPVAELHPTYCGSPPSTEERSRLLPLARDPVPTTRSLAAAVRLSADV